MILNSTKYAWRKGTIDNIIVTNELSEHTFSSPILIYQINGTGNIIIKADLENDIYEGELPFAPSAPIACDSLFIQSNIQTEISFVCLIGQNKVTISNHFNSSSGMTTLQSNLSGNNAATIDMPFTGFMFNGVEVTKIYVNTNKYIGFNSNEMHLKVHYRSGGGTYTYYKYVSDEGMPFLKIRFSGYTRSGYTTTQYRSLWELYLLENGDMYLHVLQGPTNSSYLGTNSLYCNGLTTSLTLNTGTTDTYVSFYRADQEGKNWNIVYEQYPGVTKDAPLYLAKIDDKFYSVNNNILVEQPITELKATSFVQYGSEEKVTSAIMPNNPKIYVWAPNDTFNLSWSATAYPNPQTVSVVIDMNHESITGINSFTADKSGTINVSHSFNGSDYTNETPIETWLNMDGTDLYNSLLEDKKLYLRFILYGNAQFKYFKINYKN